MSTESAMVHLDNFKCLDNNFLVFTMPLLHVSCLKEDKISRISMDMVLGSSKCTKWKQWRPICIWWTDQCERIEYFESIWCRESTQEDDGCLLTVKEYKYNGLKG